MSNGAEQHIAYYQAQANGRGVGGVHKYAKTQRGNGIGSFFGGLFRRIMPYIKSGISSVGSELVSSGANILRDVLKGRDTKDSISERLTNVGTNLGAQASAKVSSMLGLGYKRRRKTVKKQSSSCKRRKKVARKPKVSRNKKDIFGF